MKRKVYDLLQKYNGTLMLKDATAAGISRVTLKRMVDNGEIDREFPGVYTLPGQFADRLMVVQKKIEKAVISHATALDLYDLSDNIPQKIHLTLPYNYHVSASSVKNYAVELHYTNPEWYEIGKTTTKSYAGNLIVAYDMERTLCDIWNPWSKSSEETRIKSLQEYMSREERDINKLSKYRTIIPTSDDMKYYIKALV